MEKQFIKLIELQDKVNQAIEKLLSLADKKKSLVIQGNVKELDSLIREEGIVISELEKWEGARFHAQCSISAEHRNLTAQELLQLVAQNCPGLVFAMQESINKLTTNLGCLKALNNHNNELLQQSLQHIAFLEAAMVGDRPGTYSDKGQQSELVRARINILDRKI